MTLAQDLQPGTVTTTKPSILLVDDFQDAREMYAAYLSFAGFEVFEAADGQEAIEKAFARSPNLILMDLSLPVLDGWEATRRLKQDARTRHIPVIALTGHALDSAARQAMEAGCVAFLAKPCLPDKLLSTVRAMLSAREQ